MIICRGCLRPVDVRFYGGAVFALFGLLDALGEAVCALFVIMRGFGGAVSVYMV